MNVPQLSLGDRNLTKHQISTLLYLETRAVDFGGRVNAAHLNDDDSVWLKQLNAEGFLQFGRIVRQDCNSDGNFWVELSEEAWQLAARFRRERADRLLKNRHFRRTSEASSEGGVE